MTMTYAEYGDLMAKLLAINPSTTLTVDNVNLLNAMIDYGELRIYRELDFLYAQTEADTADLTAGVRTIAVPGSLIIVNSAWLVTPASTPAALGTRNPMQRGSAELQNFFWPSTSLLGTPTQWAMLDNDTIIVAPSPDQGFRVNCVGVFRPDPLYVDTNGTFITDNLPDLFVQASLVFGHGSILQNFGAKSDDPQATQSAENQYQTLKAGVSLETLRQKAWMQSWQPFSPSPEAAQSRT